MKSSKNTKRLLSRMLILLIILALAIISLSGCKKSEVPANQPQEAPANQPQEEPANQPQEEPIEEPVEKPQEEPEEEPQEEPLIDETGWYYSKDEVALYIHTYGHLPDNYITKNEAKKLGWSGGSVERYAKGMAIGGDRFGNYEGNLPAKNGRTYTECDIDTLGEKSRGAKRIIFSNDGLIFYTEDHYETFELLYGEEEG